ncbi:MAG: C4-type zinc ribbon domain-containing protein [Nitrospirota bacterium]
MNDQLRYLIELQQIDSKILNKKCMIDEIPSKISEAEVPLKITQADLDKMKQRHESLEKERRDKERHLEDINEKIKKLKARTAEIKTNKEYQAHLREIESVEKERYAIEDEILVAMEALDVSSNEVKAAEAKVISEKEKIDILKRKLNEETSEAKKELAMLKEKRAGIVDGIDGEIYDQYITLLELGEGIAVIDVKEAVCQGCNMNIPPQLFVEIKKNEKIIHCPQCHRILYYLQIPL